MEQQAQAWIEYGFTSRDMQIATETLQEYFRQTEWGTPERGAAYRAMDEAEQLTDAMIHLEGWQYHWLAELSDHCPQCGELAVHIDCAAAYACYGGGIDYGRRCFRCRQEWWDCAEDEIGL